MINPILDDPAGPVSLVAIGNFGWVELYYCELATPVTVSLAFSQVLFSLLEEGCKKYPIFSRENLLEIDTFSLY